MLRVVIIQACYSKQAQEPDGAVQVLGCWSSVATQQQSQYQVDPMVPSMGPQFGIPISPL